MTAGYTRAFISGMPQVAGADQGVDIGQYVYRVNSGREKSLIRIKRT